MRDHFSPPTGNEEVAEAEMWRAFEWAAKLCGTVELVVEDQTTDLNSEWTAA